MKKLNNTIKAVIFGAIITSCGTAKAEDMCTPQPTCESLGFTKTEAICAGQDTLKCPFDRNKVYCYKQSDVLVYYKVGDNYRNKDGIIIGKVKSISDGGLHGTVENIATAGSYVQASDYCNNLGHLRWRLSYFSTNEYIGGLSCECKGTDSCSSAGRDINCSFVKCYAEF